MSECICAGHELQFGPPNPECPNHVTQPKPPPDAVDEVVGLLRYQIQKGKNQGGPVSLTHELAESIHTALSLVGVPVAEVYANRPDNGVPKLIWLPGVPLPIKGDKLFTAPLEKGG